MPKNKIKGIRAIKSVGATVLILSAKKGRKGKSFKSFSKQLITKQINGIELSAQTMIECLNNEAGFARRSKLDFPSFKMKNALAKLKDYICVSGRTDFMVLMVGYGVLDEGKTFYMLDREKNYKYDRLFLNETIEIFDNRTNKDASQHLFLLLNFGSSGDWTDQNKKRGKGIISIDPL